MIKRIISIFSILLLFSFVSCKSSDTKYNMNYFKIDEATDFGKNYMKDLSLNADNRICSYVLDKTSEGANYVILTFKVTRKGNGNINTDLDQFDIEVSKKDKGYVVNKVKSKNLQQVYVDGNNLRIRNQDTGMSDLLIRMKDLPSEVYPQMSDIMINKESTNNEMYNMLSIDIKGKNVGIVTRSNGNNFISLAQVEDTKQTIGDSGQAQSGDSNSSGGVDSKMLQDIMEKPIAAKLVPYDLVSGDTIDKFVFSADGNFLLIQQSKDNISRLHIYKNPSGQKVNMNLDGLFPEDQYSLEINTINNDGVFVNVKSVANNKTHQGLYKFDLKTEKVSQIKS